MFESLEIFKMSSAMASHAGRRQALVAENMANVDTPGYKAKRLPSFSEIAADPSQTFMLRASRGAHMHGVGPQTAQASVTLEKDYPSPDGNTVSVETEMLESVSVKREHDRAIAIYKSAMTILRSTLSRN